MEYESDFHRSFMERTQKNLKEYRGNYEATHLINSLLGLLIIPKERLFNRVPTTPLDQLNPAQWGSVSDWLTQPAKCDLGHVHTLTLQQLVRKLRNAVAHFKIHPYPAKGDVAGFEFSDRLFKVKIPVNDLKLFVTQLAFELAEPQKKDDTPC